MKKESKEFIRELFFVLLFSSALAVLLCWVYPPRWESNDDWAMASMVAGSYGTPTSYMVFVHPAIGVILKWLYILFPAAPWLGILWEAVVFASFSAILWVFRTDLGKLQGTVVWTVFTVMFGWAFYSVVNFTRVGAVAAGAGYLLVFSCLRRRQYPGVALGAVLVWAGYMIRIDSWYMITALAGGVGLAELFAGLQNVSPREIFEKVLKKKYYIGTVVFVFAGCLCLTLAENVYNGRDPQIAKYKEFTVLRSQLWDYPSLTYDEIKDELASIGVSRTNYNALMTGFIISDPVIYPPETLAAIKELQGSASPDLIQGVAGTVEQMLDDQGFFMFLACAVFALAASGRKRLFLTGWLILAFMGMNLYLGSIGRNPDRVFQSLCAITALYLLWSIEKERIQKRQAAALVAFAVLLNNTIYFQPESHRIPPISEEEQILETAMDRFQDTGRYYLCALTQTSHQMYDLGMHGLENLGLGDRQHLILTGGWGVNMPVYCWQLAQAGTENPYRDVLFKDNILIIDNVGGQLFTYIRENYDDYNNRKNWSVCDKIADGVYVIGFNDNKSATVSGTGIEWITAQEAEGEEENLYWIEVYFGGDDSLKEPENVYYLQITGSSGETKTFRGEAQQTEKGLKLLVGIHEAEITDEEIQIGVLRKNLVGQYEETESTTVGISLKDKTAGVVS